jgi:hypothetical protein
MDSLRLQQGRENVPRPIGVVAIAIQLGDQALLSCYVLFAKGNVLLSLSETLQ